MWGKTLQACGEKPYKGTARLPRRLTCQPIKQASGLALAAWCVSSVREFVIAGASDSNQRYLYPYSQAPAGTPKAESSYPSSALIVRCRRGGPGGAAPAVRVEWFCGEDHSLTIRTASVPSIGVPSNVSPTSVPSVEAQVSLP